MDPLSYSWFFSLYNPLVRNHLEGDDLNRDWCVLAGLPVTVKHILHRWTPGPLSARCLRPTRILNTLEHVARSLLSLGTLGVFYDRGFRPALAVWVHRPCFFKVFQEFNWNRKENSSVSLRLSKWMNLIMRVCRLLWFMSCALCADFSGLLMKGGETVWLGGKKRGICHRIPESQAGFGWKGP